MQYFLLLILRLLPFTGLEGDGVAELGAKETSAV